MLLQESYFTCPLFSFFFFFLRSTPRLLQHCNVFRLHFTLSSTNILGKKNKTISNILWFDDSVNESVIQRYRLFCGIFPCWTPVIPLIFGGYIVSYNRLCMRRELSSKFHSPQCDLGLSYIHVNIYTYIFIYTSYISQTHLCWLPYRKVINYS